MQTALRGAPAGPAYLYDPFANTVAEAPDAFTLDLPPYGSRVVLVPRRPLPDAAPAPAPFRAARSLPLTACTVSLAPYTDLSAWGEPFPLEAPAYVSSLPGCACFAGRIRYRFAVELDAAPAAARLCLSGVREAAAVSVNGEACGVRLCPDYTFPLRGLRAGRNEIEVELNTTLGRAMNDFLSSFLPIEPTGLTGAALELE